MMTPGGFPLRVSLGAVIAALLIGCGPGAQPDLATTASPLVQGTPTTARQVRNVGTLVKRSGPSAPWRWHGCSGVLIGSRAFLTAGHCLIFANPANEFGVTFAPAMDLSDPWNPMVPPEAVVYPGTVVIHPELKVSDYTDYTGAWEDQTYPDLAVIVTKDEVEGIPPARLPALGYLDRLLASAEDREDALEMGIAGYGLTDSNALLGAGDPDWGIRRYGTTTFLKVNAQRAFFTRAPSMACYEDSGAPDFPVGRAGRAPDHVRLTVGTLIGNPDAEYFASAYCSDWRTNVSVRLDTALALSFLSQFADSSSDD